MLPAFTGMRCCSAGAATFRHGAAWGVGIRARGHESVNGNEVLTFITIPIIQAVNAWHRSILENDKRVTEIFGSMIHSCVFPVNHHVAPIWQLSHKASMPSHISNRYTFCTAVCWTPRPVDFSHWNMSQCETSSGIGVREPALQNVRLFQGP